MRDIYLYEGTDILKNLLDIRDRTLLNEAEADYVTIDYFDVFDIPRDAESVLSEMRNKNWSVMNIHDSAVQFSDSLAKLWRVHPFREGNTRTTVTFCCQYADAVGLNPDRKLFEDNAQYVRTALVAYNAVFDDIGDVSKPEYLIKIVEDAISRGKQECV